MTSGGVAACWSAAPPPPSSSATQNHLRGVCTRPIRSEESRKINGVLSNYNLPKGKRRIAASRLSDFCQAQSQNGVTLMKNDLGFVFDSWMTLLTVPCCGNMGLQQSQSSQHLIPPEGSKSDQESANWAPSSTFKTLHMSVHLLWPCVASGRCRVTWRPSLPYNQWGRGETQALTWQWDRNDT